MGAASGFPYADMFAIEYTAPNSVPVSSVAVSTTPGQMDFQFPGTTDPAPSSRGMAYYILSRAPYGTTSWSTIGEIVVGFGQFADKNVSAGTSYAYKIDSFDYCGNSTSVTFNATTPPAGSVDPRRTGVAPNAPLYGALGANVDLLSGNLNYNLPLLKAQARGGWGVTFGLNYDSQFWKKEGSTIWNFGVNRGYGFGWRVMAGSVTRYYASSGVTSHIVFTDSTGTEYKLDRKVNPDGSSSGSYTGWWASSSANFYGIFDGFDSRGLPNTLTNTTDSVTVVSSVSYGVAGEMTTFVSGGGTETRSYNVNGQMTTLNLPGRTVTYNFPAAGSNNGKVSSVVDSGETISYLYL